MPNALVTPLWTLKRVGRIGINNLKFANNVDRSYDDDFEQAGAKMGDTINLRLPWQPVTTSGQAFQQQPIVDRIVPVTLQEQKGVNIGTSSFQQTVDIDDFTGRYIAPQAVQLANTLDFDGLSIVPNLTYNCVGTPGTAPTDNNVYLSANTTLSGFAAPPDRMVLTSPKMQQAITSANFAFFNPVKTISGSIQKGVYATDMLGFSEWYWDQNVNKHIVGTYGGTPLVNGANQTGSTLTTDGWASTLSNLNVGDRFTIGAASGGASSTGVFPVNPQNRQALDDLQVFVVQAPISDTTGAMVISISPAIITSGQFQTVTASPADNAVITVIGQSGAVGTVGFAWVKEAVVCVMADLVKPIGGAISERISSKPLGFSLRMAQQWQALSDQNLCRVEYIAGWQNYRPEWTSVIYG
jgi:hypothetical protein